MNIKDFFMLNDLRECRLKILFIEKQKQYGQDDDVFANNNAAAELVELSPESHSLMQASKHLAKLVRLAHRLDYPLQARGKLTLELMEQWKESMDDISVWMSIVNGLLEERFQKGMVEGGV